MDNRWMDSKTHFLAPFHSKINKEITLSYDKPYPSLSLDFEKHLAIFLEIILGIVQKK